MKNPRRGLFLIIKQRCLFTYGISHCNTRAGFVVNAGLRRDADIGVSLEDNHDVGAAKLEVGDLVALTKSGALFSCHDDRRYLSHTHRQDSHLTNRRLDHHQTTHLHKLISGFVESYLLADDTGTTLFIAFDGLSAYSKIYHTLHLTGLKHLSAHAGVLTVVVGRVKELVCPDTAGEII